MSETDAPRSEFERRMMKARRRLTGTQGRDGLQAWLRREIKRRAGWEPAKATVHRWVTGRTRPGIKAAGAVKEIEREAAGTEPPSTETDMPPLGSKANRNVRLVADWIRGDSLSVLAERYGVSRERVRQVVDRAGVSREDGDAA